MSDLRRRLVDAVGEYTDALVGKGDAGDASIWHTGVEAAAQELDAIVDEIFGPIGAPKSVTPARFIQLQSRDNSNLYALDEQGGVWVLGLDPDSMKRDQLWHPVSGRRAV